MGVTYPGAQITGTEFVSGKLVICTEGSMHVSGPLTVAGDATFTGTVDLTAATVTNGIQPFTGGTITSGLDISTAGQGLAVAEGADAKQGVATLGSDTIPVPGSVTVANASVTANSRIFLTVQSPGAAPAVAGAPYVSARTAGASFTITSTNTAIDATADTSVVAYEIIEPG